MEGGAKIRRKSKQLPKNCTTKRLTYTRTGTKSSAAGTALSWARLNRFMIIADTLRSQKSIKGQPLTVLKLSPGYTMHFICGKFKGC